jgi:hypothetical protein
MSDQSASSDLGMAPPPEPAPSTPITMDMSFDDAMLAKTQRLADPAWRDKYMNGDVGCKAEMDALMHALTPKQPQPSDPTSLEQAIDWLRERADIPESVATQIRDNVPVSAQEYRLAQQMKEKLFRDKSWVAKYLDGDRDAATQIALVNVILSSRVK